MKCIKITVPFSYINFCAKFIIGLYVVNNNTDTALSQTDQYTYMYSVYAPWAVAAVFIILTIAAVIALIIIITYIYKRSKKHGVVNGMNNIFDESYYYDL